MRETVHLIRLNIYRFRLEGGDDFSVFHLPGLKLNVFGSHQSNLIKQLLLSGLGISCVLVDLVV